MENITELKKVRQDIIKDYSAKDILDTHIDKEVSKMNDLQYVIVKDIIKETDDTKSFILEPDVSKGTRELAPFKAGQYISLKLFIDDAYVTRAYSLSSSPSEALKNFYRITIKKVPNGLVSNIMFKDIKVGDGLTISKPMGEFGYNKIRDEENVIAIAGGSGITPFMSLAKAIKDKDEECSLTVIYSVKKEKDIIFKDEINELNKNKNINFVITLTEEEKDNYLNGYINEEMIEPYLKEFNTVLMCGPKGLYQTMNEILLKFNIPKKNVHYENFNVMYEPSEKNTYSLKVIMKDEVKTIKCKSDESLLISMEKAGIKAPSSCRVGICGFCRSILIQGKVKTIGATQVKALSENDYIHPCVTYPESDVVLKLDI